MSNAIIIVSIIAVLIVSILLIMIKTRLTHTESSNLKKEMAEMANDLKSTQTVSAPMAGKSEPSVEEGYMALSNGNTVKGRVLDMVEKYRMEVNEEDLPKIQSQLKEFFSRQAVEPYYRFLDIRQKESDCRVVVIGDTHCDYMSLAGIMKKLSLSSYDYFENAYFVFLGDYLDRGRVLFENLLLLSGLKQLLGERCIFLKGNHELIEYNKSTGELESMVQPSDTCPILNEYCVGDKVFLEKFAQYFSRLPYYLLLKTHHGTDLLVHAGIPRDAYKDNYTISHDTGEMLMSEDQSLRSRILDNMIWSDPSDDVRRMQGASSRFEFGSQQFEEFVKRNRIDRMFRSHEPVANGVKSFYGDRLYTIFSNGGSNNPDTGYDEVKNPVFAIIGIDGTVRFESIFFKRVKITKGLSEFSSVMYMETVASESLAETGDLHLNNEFFITNQ